MARDAQSFAAEVAAGRVLFLPLLGVRPEFFSRLRAEALRLMRDAAACDLGTVDRDYFVGDCRGISLLNYSGSSADMSSEVAVRPGKRLTVSGYPALEALRAAIPHLNMYNLWCLGPNSAFRPHREPDELFFSGEMDPQCVLYRGQSLKLRFHLPILSCAGSFSILGDREYTYAEGTVYFYNDSVVHGGVNRGTQLRAHLVWDAWLTPTTWELFFCGKASPLFEPLSAQAVEALSRFRAIPSLPEYFAGL